MNKPELYRYTNIESVIHLLQSQELTLLNPAKWTDRNDSHYIEVYKKKKNLSHVFAICFSTKRETYNHWHVFSHGTNGAIIAFDKNMLLSALATPSRESFPNGTHRDGSMIYKTLDNMAAEQLKTESLPFIKRVGFISESEFRIIREYKNHSNVTIGPDVVNIHIDLSCIKKITLNPWIDPDRFESIKKTLQGISGCKNITIGRSWLLNNERWKNYAERSQDES